jgi:NhaP-type Na+/H+ or K+/H+ antiporter
MHDLSIPTGVAIGVALVVWSLVAERLERWNFTSPMWFVLAGLLVAHGPLAMIEVRLGAEGVRTIAELALAVVLFGDAARVNVRELEADALLPTRLLVGGLPITIALGTVTAKLLLPSLSWWVCAVIGAAVAPTDAALGAAIIEDERVPERIRRVLNVESGLNDGIATPFVNFFLVAAVVGTSLETESEAGAIEGLLKGLAGGVIIGAAGALLLALSRRHGWGGHAYRHLAVTALALLSYGATVVVHGNGFVAAFVAGLAYGAFTKDALEESLEFTHGVAQLGSMVVWFLFGAVMLPALRHATWREFVFAALALTVVRMAPVALVLFGTGFDRATVGVIGWFGPRGLASVVFALLAEESLFEADATRVVAAISATVAMSVVLHGVTAAPIGRRYGATHSTV